MFQRKEIRLTVAILSTFVICESGSLFAQVATGQFLNFPYNAAQVSIGTSAHLHGVDGILANPSSTIPAYNSIKNQFEASVSLQQLIADMQYINLTAMKSFAPEIGNLGVAFLLLNYGDIPNSAENGDSNGFLSAKDTAFVLNYSREITEGYNAGMNLKMYMAELGNESSNSFSADLGFKKMYIFRNNPLWLGLTFNNVGPALQIAGVASALPGFVNLSAAYSWQKILFNGLQLTLAPELTYYYEGSYLLGLGAEINYRLAGAAFYLRSRFYEGQQNGNWSIGFGGSYAFSSSRLEFTGGFNPNVLSYGNLVTAKYSYQKEVGTFRKLGAKGVSWQNIRQVASSSVAVKALVMEDGNILEGFIPEVRDSDLSMIITNAKIRRDNINEIVDLSEERDEKGEISNFVVITLKEGGKLQGNLKIVDNRYFLTGNSYLGNNFSVAPESIASIIKVRKMKIQLNNKIIMIGSLAEETENYLTLEKITTPKGPQKIGKDEIFDAKEGIVPLQDAEKH